MAEDDSSARWKNTGISRPPLAVIFDLDDTLVESTVDFAKFRRRVIDRLEEWGEERHLYKMNETIVVIINRFEERMRSAGLSEAAIRDRLSTLDRIMDEVELERVDDTAPIDSAPEVLKSLKRRGLKIGVLTRGCEAYATRALQRTGMLEFVDAVESRNSEMRPKPDPGSYLRLVQRLGVRKEDTIFVGDHPIDAQCADKAGVRFIGVGTGAVSEKMMMEAGSSEFLPDVAHLVEWLDECHNCTKKVP